MVTSINSAVTASPARTSAKSDSARSSALRERPGVWVEPTIGGLFFIANRRQAGLPDAGAAPVPPLPLNASARVKTRKRRHRGHHFDRFFGGERTGEL